MTGTDAKLSGKANCSSISEGAGRYRPELVTSSVALGSQSVLSSLWTPGHCVYHSSNKLLGGFPRSKRGVGECVCACVSLYVRTGQRVHPLTSDKSGSIFWNVVEVHKKPK